MASINEGTLNYRDELLRKGIHLCSLSMPIIYYFITKELAINILLVMTIIAVVLDVGRYFIPSVGKLFYKIFGFMLREHEKDEKKKNLNGATYVLLSALICVLIFPKVIFITAFAILIISDMTAALIGRKYGKHPLFKKSLEGTIAFFISACIVVLFTPKINYLPLEYLIGFIAAFIGAFVENISWGFADDNLSIPLAVGGTMWFLYGVLLPEVSLILPNVPR